MKKQKTLLLMLAALAATFCAAAHATESPRAADIVVSLKPLHSLVLAVLGDDGEATLLIDGSPHVSALRPSQAAALAAARLVFYVGGGLETFLPVETAARQVALSETDGLRLLPPSERHAEHEKHADEQQQTAHENEQNGKAADLHIWLDIDNAKILAARIAEELSAVYPQNRAVYAANAAALSRRLDALDDELRQTLAAAAGVPYVVFHDAYRYFERRYGMRAAAVISARPGAPLSVRRLQNIFRKIDETGAVCVFREPQFSPRRAAAVADNSGARIGLLDPLGADIPPSKELYFQLMRNLARDLNSCLL